jgi:hypothetical protein
LSGSSRKSPSLSSGGSTVAWKLATVRLMLILTGALWIVAANAFASGCASRTVFVPEESPMRIGPRADVRVYHRVDGVWTLSQNAIRIPEGWYLVPPSYVKADP